MKNFIVLILIATGCLLFDSCSPENCNITCQNGGSFYEDSFGDCNCNCPSGYTGDFCETADLCLTQNIDCGPHGDCENGACSCDNGYEGVTCDIESRSKFLGNYTTLWSCPSSLDALPIGITKDLNQIDEVTVTFYNTDGSSYTVENAEIDNGNTIEFLDFRIGQPDLYFEGTYTTNSSTNKGEITGTIRIGDSAPTYEYCTGTWSQQ